MTQDESLAMAALQAEVTTLKAALREAMEWNWMDDFIPEDIEDRLSKLAEDPGE